MKWVIYLLATVAFVCILRHFLPASNGVATTVGEFPIKYWMLGGFGFAVFCLLASKKLK